MGCNEGAKNTLDYNYLSAAKREGAEIRTCCEAVAVSPAEHGYEVRYLQHLSARGEHREDLLDPTDEIDRTVTGKIVVVAAGTFGSNRLLLASRGSLPGLSPALGRNYSSNGDFLSVARNCKRRRRGDWRRLDPSRGPVITLSARPRQEDADGRQMWIQEGGGPEFTEWLWHGPEVPEDLWAMRDVVVRKLKDRLRGRRRTHVSGDLARVFGSGRSSASMMVMLSLGCDVPGGRLTPARATSSSSTGIPRETRRATTTPPTPWRSAWPTSSGASSGRSRCSTGPARPPPIRWADARWPRTRATVSSTPGARCSAAPDCSWPTAR